MKIYIILDTLCFSIWFIHGGENFCRGVLIEYEGKQMTLSEGETTLDNHVVRGEGCYVVFAEKDKIKTA